MNAVSIIFVSAIALIVLAAIILFVVGSIYDKRATRKQKRQTLHRYFKQ